MRILSEQMDKRGIVIGDTGGSATILGQAYETKKGQRVFASNGNSPMGFSLPATIGAWYASDKKQNVVGLIGDGGFNLNIQELQTLKNYNIGVKIFIMNNSCLGFVRQFQKRKFEGKTEACDKKGGYIAPDFIKIANAYGLKTKNITRNNRENLTRDIKEVLNTEGPLICNVNNGNFDNYSPRIYGNHPLEEMFPFLPREEFRQNMIIEPVEGWEINK
jgi:acetolactate synthase-1/2/3 large subunit